MESLGHLPVYFDGSDGSSLKRLEGTSLEELCHIDDTKRVTKIRFVGTKLQHSLFVADDRIWCLCNGIAFRRKFFKSSGEHFFSDCKYIFLCCKAHFKIELVKFARRTVCSCILVSEARGDLEIFIKAGYHQKLFVLLWCLWQCIKFTFVLSARYNVITCTFR